MYGQEIKGTIERTRSETREEVLVPRVKSVAINGIQIQFSCIVPENTRTEHCAVPKASCSVAYTVSMVYAVWCCLSPENYLIVKQLTVQPLSTTTSIVIGLFSERYYIKYLC